jgi:hypothetical protein
MEIAKFEVGKTYSTRSIGDHNCIIRMTVASRTEKTIKTTDGKSFRVSICPYDNAELIRPWGRYSMAPTINATDLKALRFDWEKDAA